MVLGVVEPGCKPDDPVGRDCGLDGGMCGSGSLSDDEYEELDEEDENEL